MQSSLAEKILIIPVGVDTNRGFGNINFNFTLATSAAVLTSRKLLIIPVD
jgi:hypothetical protein